MQSRISAFTIAAALSLAVGASPAVAAQTNTQEGVAARTSEASELEQLKAALAALQAKVAELEARSAAQADASTRTAEFVQTVQDAQARNDGRFAALDKFVNKTSFSGKMFLDFTHINQRASDSGKTNATSTGVDVKRFYFGVSHILDEVWSTNLTTDFNFVSSTGQTSLFVKKAYVQGMFDRAAVLRVGSVDLPWIPFVESFYGYRYVEQTVTDRLKFGTSTDWGVHLGGDVGPDKSLNYAVSMVNGGGFRNPSRSQSVDLAARVGFVPFAGAVIAVGGYSGKLGKNTRNVDALHTARRGDILIAYADSGYRIGSEYFTAKNWNNVLSPLTDKANGYSFWASAAVAPATSVFARYDHANLSTRLDDAADDEYYNLGIEYQVTNGFKLAGVWKHTNNDRSLLAPDATLVRTLKTDEVGLWGEVLY